MARNEQDPAASTQQFRAFARSGESPRKGPNPVMVTALVAGIIVVVAVIALLVG
jgi:hypothetical protein